MSIDLSQLKAVAKKLNTLSDTLTRELSEFESELSAMSLGLEVYIIRQDITIGFGKFGEKWQLIAKEGSEERKPLLQAKRSTKQIMSMYKQELIDRLQAKAESLLEVLEKE